MDPREDVVNHYESGAYEHQRLSRGLPGIELLRTKEVLRTHLGPDPRRVLDVGGGPGVHAAWLDADGHDVTLLDVVPLHARQAKVRSEKTGDFSVEQADARALPHPDGSFDVALLLGPLYHLTERTDRLLALSEAKRVLAAGGLVFAAAISRFASLFDGLARGYLFDPQFRQIVADDLATGQHRNPTGHDDWFTTAYFHHPDELTAEAGAAGFEVLDVVGLEGMVAWVDGLESRLDDGQDRAVILDAAEAVSHEPTLMGLSPHILLVGTKPS